MTAELVKSPVKKGPRATVQEWLESDYFKTEISKALTLTNGNPDAYRRAALTTVLRNPALVKVSKDSLFTCLFDLAQMGLYPDGRRAHLIPFGDICTLIVDYKGIAELARRHGDVVYIHCDVVHQGEYYVCSYGSDGRLEHRPDSDKEDLPITHAYSYVKFLVGDKLVEEYTQMSIKSIERIRDRSRAKDKGPWVTDYAEMAKKTVFRRHSKTLALSPETRRAVEYGEDEEFQRFRAAVPAVVPKRPEVIDVEESEQPEAAEESKAAHDLAQAMKKGLEKATKEGAKKKAVEVEKKDEKPEELFGSEAQIGQEMTARLEALVKEGVADRNMFFTFLNAQGLRHVRDEKLKVLTYVDLAPSDIENLIEHWVFTLETYQRWLEEKKDVSPF